MNAGSGPIPISSVGRLPRFLLDEHGGRDLLADLRWRGTMTPPPEPVVAGPLGGLRIVVTRPRDGRHRSSRRWRRKVPKRYRFGHQDHRAARWRCRASHGVAGSARWRLGCGDLAKTVPPPWPRRSVSAHSPMAFGSQWSVPEPAIRPSRSVSPSISCLPMRSPRSRCRVPAPPIAGGRVVLPEPRSPRDLADPSADDGLERRRGRRLPHGLCRH